MDVAPPFGVRELSEATGTSAPTLSRVLGLLEREGVVTRRSRGKVVAVDWEGVIRRWVQDYDQAKSNTVIACLEPRGLESITTKLRATTFAYAATGAFAAQHFDPIAPARVAALYVTDAVDAAETLGLRETDAGANVVLLEPFDPVVFDRTQECDGLRCVAPSQLAVGAGVVGPVATGVGAAAPDDVPDAPAVLVPVDHLVVVPSRRQCPRRLDRGGRATHHRPAPSPGLSEARSSPRSGHCNSLCSTTYVVTYMAWKSSFTLRSTVGCSRCRGRTAATDSTGGRLALISPPCRWLWRPTAATSVTPSATRSCPRVSTWVLFGEHRRRQPRRTPSVLRCDGQSPNTKNRLDGTPRQESGLRQSRTREEATQKGRARNGMDETHQRQLPADDASTNEVPPDAWQHKITPSDFYAEVEADPRAPERVRAAGAEIGERQATLAQVRKARAFTQATLAELLEIDQSEVSRVEHRSNMLLSTLRSFIRATGGELQLIATFPDAEPVQLLVGTEASDIDG